MCNDASITAYNLFAVAQTRVLKGKVVDETQSPLTGATIKVKGSTTATTTDADGGFSINISTDAKSLEVSYIGYATKEVPIAGNDMTIALEPGSNQGLDEVVVIGYGTARKRDLTGSMVTIGAKNFNKGIMTSPDQLIQGKTPGVMVINNRGSRVDQPQYVSVVTHRSGRATIRYLYLMGCQCQVTLHCRRVGADFPRIEGTH
ncbi:carboxypeptidase-like regulatory domain-containing protein [Sphingobacterium sp. E70]|uniref:carboxypeptidase-like regulatory domain-containing protein n=1 Tax=Sphingobacterium sp. E70 TaxID=2853439 RepID=UPI00211BC5AF|nr:carboxypeptidase-like regulatory domain-containing protein [Sphingobacterium sp. E70]ULT26663.1 carboxypeptidase-like regulatory domain-containing protein [Sphingobacterium sp. E70]